MPEIVVQRLIGARLGSATAVLASSGAAFLALLWSVLLDWRYVLGEWQLTMAETGLAALVYTAIIGGWLFSLLSAARGSRMAVIALLMYSSLLCAYALLDLFTYCPTTCARINLYYIANWANLTLGLLAAGSGALRIRHQWPVDQSAIR